MELISKAFRLTYIDVKKTITERMKTMRKIGVYALILTLSVGVLAGCTSSGSTPKNSPEDISSINLNIDEAMKEKEIKLEDVKSIELFDLDNKAIDKSFGEDEIKDIITAYNASMITHDSYIMMISGKQMRITLKDDTMINIHSYGSPTHVVASGENISYHLNSPEIAKILLDK